VKSRLSSLIAAVSGKIGNSSKPADDSRLTSPTSAPLRGRSNSEDTPNNSSKSATGQLEKWHSALKIGTKPTGTQQLENGSQGQLVMDQLTSRDGDESEEEDNGRLVAGRLLLGTKILVEREGESGRLFPAVISGHDGDRVAVTWKEQHQHLQQQQLTAVLASGSPAAPLTYYEPEELVVKGVLDLPALSSDRLRSGSRVAVFPHPETSYLVPGTVRHELHTTI